MVFVLSCSKKHKNLDIGLIWCTYHNLFYLAYEIGEYEYYDGLWEHCRHQTDTDGNTIGDPECEFNMGITQLLNEDVNPDQPPMEETYITELVQICVVRVAVIIACLMPFVGLVSG